MVPTPEAVHDQRSALIGILPYALSRVEDMRESAEETHGDGKAHRCWCFRRAQAFLAQAYTFAEQEPLAQQLRDQVEADETAARDDPGEPIGPNCSAQGCWKDWPGCATGSHSALT
jgi:hypothetical protein